MTSTSGSKPRMTFYTNMPTPYQLDFCGALADFFELHVVFFTARENDRLWNLDIGDKFKFTILENSWLTRKIQAKIISFHFSWSIFKALFKDESDCIVVNGTYWSPNVVLAFLIGRLKGKKVFYYGEPVFPSSQKIGRLIKRHVLTFPLRKFTDSLFAIGKLAEESYKSLGYVKPIYNIPYNIDVTSFDPANLDSGKLRELTANVKPNQEVLLLTSGSLIERKGIDVLIMAFLQLPKENLYKLLIMGDGPEKQKLKALAGGSDNIIFLGFQDKHEVPYYFRIADIFVFASRYDGWGLVINEAVASDTPIISTNTVGATADKLIDKFNALIVDSDDSEALSQAMQKLISDTNLRHFFVSNTQKTKIELSSAYNASKVYDIYHSTK